MSNELNHRNCLYIMLDYGIEIHLWQGQGIETLRLVAAILTMHVEID